MRMPQKTTYRLPSELKNRMANAVKDAYGKKGKSRWIKEAIAELINLDTGLSSVGLGEDYEVQDESDVLVLDETAYQNLQTAMTMIRRQDPLYSGVQSAVIRAAIRLRLDSRKNTNIE